MPMIQISERDLLRGKICTPGWYKVRIDSIGEKASNDGGSINYPVEATIVKSYDNNNDFLGVPLGWMFNSKGMGFATGFLEAFGVKVEPGVRFELSSAVGKEIDVFVENGLYEGRANNKVNHKYRAVQG